MSVGNSRASAKALSYRTGIKALKKGGYGGELLLPKLVKKTAHKTVIWSYPGAKGEDRFTLTHKGRYVHIHALFGTLDDGHFSVIHYLNYTKNKTVKV